MTIESVNPTTNELIKRYPEMTSKEVSEAVAAAHCAFLAWREVPFSERASLMKRAAEGLCRRSGEYAWLMALEMGKPVAAGRAKAKKCAWACDYYAENAARFLAKEPIPTNATRSFITFEPLGVVLAVMPWNFPFWQVFRFAAPKQRSAPGSATTTPTTQRASSPRNRSQPTPQGASSPSSRWAWSSPSCPGTSPSGRSSASPPRG